MLESLYPFVGASLIWTAMTQTSHVQDDCHQPVAEDDCWTARQIAPLLRLLRAQPKERELVAMLTAGLNMQSLHHAIPTVAQSRLAGLYEEYAEIAARHGAAPRTSRNILTASRELLGASSRTTRPCARAARGGALFIWRPDAWPGRVVGPRGGAGGAIFAGRRLAAVRH